MAYSNNKGFSFIELVVTLGIISILAAISVLSVSMMRKEQLKSKGKALLTDLQAVRSQAMLGETDKKLTGEELRYRGVRFDAQSYEIFLFDDKNGNFQYDGTDEEANAYRKDISPAQIMIQKKTGEPLTSPAPGDVVIFDRFGYPRSADWQIAGMNDTMIIVLNSPVDTGYTPCITIDMTRIREGAWDAASSTCAIR